MSDSRDVLAVCLALCSGKEEEAQALLARRPELATGSVHVAAARADIEALTALLDRDAQLVDRALPGPRMSPLSILCHASPSSSTQAVAERVAAAELLLVRRADPNGPGALIVRTPNDRDAWASALGGAAGSVKSPLLCRALLAGGADPNDGIALFRAAESDAWDCFDELLKGGAQVNDTQNRRGTTPLHHVLDTAYTLDRVEELLARGADPNVLGSNPSGLGETALHVAVRRRRIEPLAVLVDHGASLDAPTSDGMGTGMSAWRHALRRGFDDVAAWLAERGAIVTRTPGDELALLLLADDLEAARAMLRARPELAHGLSLDEARLLPDLAARNKKDAVALLLDAGWDACARGLDGGLALHQAAWFAAAETAELLIARQAPLDVVCNVHDGTPLAWCAHGSRFSGGAQGNPAYARIAELLCSAGAALAWSGDPDEDPGGRRLVACSSPEVAEVLRRHGAQEG